VFEKRALLEPKRKDLTGGSKKMHSEKEGNVLCTFLHINREITSRMGLPSSRPRMGRKSAYRNLGYKTLRNETCITTHR
jgi:hypothetical protein